MRSARHTTRIASFLMALALFGAGLLASLHHHEVEAKGSEHCATCHLGHQAQLGDGPAEAMVSGLPSLFVGALETFSSELLPFSLFRIGKFSQAPPRA